MTTRSQFDHLISLFVNQPQAQKLPYLAVFLHRVVVVAAVQIDAQRPRLAAAVLRPYVDRLAIKPALRSAQHLEICVPAEGSAADQRGSFTIDVGQFRWKIKFNHGLAGLQTSTQMSAPEGLLYKM